MSAVFSSSAVLLPGPLPHPLAGHTEAAARGQSPQGKPPGQLVGHGRAVQRRSQIFFTCLGRGLGGGGVEGWGREDGEGGVGERGEEVNSL